MPTNSFPGIGSLYLPCRSSVLQMDVLAAVKFALPLYQQHFFSFAFFFNQERNCWPPGTRLKWRHIFSDRKKIVLKRYGNTWPPMLRVETRSWHILEDLCRPLFLLLRLGSLRTSLLTRQGVFPPPWVTQGALSLVGTLIPVAFPGWVFLFPAFYPFFAYCSLCLANTPFGKWWWGLFWQDWSLIFISIIHVKYD